MAEHDKKAGLSNKTFQIQIRKLSIWKDHGVGRKGCSSNLPVSAQSGDTGTKYELPKGWVSVCKEN